MTKREILNFAYRQAREARLSPREADAVSKLVLARVDQHVAKLLRDIIAEEVKNFKSKM